MGTRGRVQGCSLWVALMLAVMPSPRATAQERRAAEDAEARARALFAEGAAALGEDRYEPAREALRESLELHPHGPTAFNLAVALIGMGELRAATVMLREVRDGRYGPVNEASEVLALLDETVSRLGLLEVLLEGADHAEVEVDGVMRGTVRRGEPAVVEVDPGLRVVRVRNAETSSPPQRVRVAEGASTSLTMRMRPAADGAPDAAPDSSDASRELWDEPVFWVVSAAALALVGAGIALGAVLSQDGLIVDDVFGVSLTLSL